MIREGDRVGNLTVLRLTSKIGITIWAFGVPQRSPGRVGPTWCYLIDSDKVTLVDPGDAVSSGILTSILDETPFRLPDIERILITHSHSDHDGALDVLLRDTKAELWTHILYPYLRYQPASLPPQANVVQKWMAEYQQTVSQKLVPQLTGKTPQELEGSIENYDHHPLREKKLGHIEILETPGHTPDSICIIVDNFIITGDHILPYITPGASVRLGYPNSLPQPLAEEYTREAHYGLSVYLESLARIETLGEKYTLLPGHFLFAKGQIRWQPTKRAKQIGSNHLKRTKSILDLMQDAPMDLHTITQRHFHPRVIQERGLDGSLASIACTIDFLLERGYLGETEDGKLFNEHAKQFDLLSEK